MPVPKDQDYSYYLAAMAKNVGKLRPSCDICQTDPAK